MFQKVTFNYRSKKFKKISFFLLILGLLLLLIHLQHNEFISHFSSKRYIAYLPHSGLSNQRIELSNALLLAYMLNRTLIVPPAFLGSVFGWMEREQLEEHLSWLTTPKNFGKICQRPSPGRLASYLQRSKCEEYRQIAVIPWEALHDLSSLNVKLHFQSIVSTEEIKATLNLSDHDIFNYQDAQLYDWRLYEDRATGLKLLNEKANYFDSFAGRSYYKVLLMDHFESRPEKLLYLGGVFGTTRLNIVEPEHLKMQKKITQALHYRLDGPLGDTVHNIVNYLGGKGSFMSLHFRTADRPFSKKIEYNLKNFITNMTVLVDQYDLQHEHMACSTGKDAKIYIATDHKDPRGVASPLSPWFHQFPCTTTLSDLPSYLFDSLEEIEDNVNPKKSLKPYLLPLIDAMVAAHGRHVLTTPRSTFSKYIEELHEFWF
ncbi:hypothetical protein K501DRAFT_325288 [Backusella circina FSU 941]|nr:hypothetical protein K501DRAFT_325288 [Backusella circina FSU 941]